MSIIVRGIDYINWVIKYVIGITLGSMAVIIAYQVFSRYVLGTSLSWSEELLRYLMVWVVFLGAAVALREKSLIGIEMFVERFPETIHRILKVFSYIVCMVFFIFIMYKGINVLESVSNQRSPAMRISMVWPYAAMPIGAFFMLLNSVAVLIEMFRKE
ncbi:TRAP transporter small permease [Thalassobacillus sp. C254]|uniref:TRAP transporter small permease n=1 Tax=Thalassobacillus sp. C254 TaxID=1225341 RepID=UPI0022B6E68A|nr:TRAP transporter small permease [Thalassobacillus sp. C254]